VSIVRDTEDVGVLTVGATATMNILFITPVPPSAEFSGSGIRAFNTLRALASCGRVTLFAPVDDKHRPLLEACRPWCKKVFAPDILTPRRPIEDRSRWGRYWETITTLDPPLVRHYDVSGFSRAVRELTADAPHLVWVFKSWLAGSLPPLDWQRVVVDFDDLLFRVMRRTMRHTPWYGSKVFCENIEIWKEELFERRLCKRVAAVLVCSEGDRRRLGHQNVHVLPNCVDVPEKEPCVGLQDADRLLFIGKMDSQPNVDAAVYFCESILPHIRKVRPRAQLYIVGREPPEDIQALHTGTDVVVTGAVSEATPYFNAAGVVVVPLRAGGGTRVKILEAFAHAKAVVSTTIGSEGLAVTHGVHLRQADTPRGFAAECVALMSDAGMRNALGAAGRELVEREYSQAVFERTVRECVSRVTGQER
jgi:glycosyltransferase involved in cell wall biosynthesis